MKYFIFIVVMIVYVIINVNIRVGTVNLIMEKFYGSALPFWNVFWLMVFLRFAVEDIYAQKKNDGEFSLKLGYCKMIVSLGLSLLFYYKIVPYALEF